MQNNIGSERVRCHLTQAELARRIGVSEATVRRWESGDNAIPSTKAYEMVQLFGCTFDYLFGRVDERTYVRA